ncbi:DsbA family oxidoreductase [Saccharomonospora viridis]|jgi:predicted DsbA family dithiol-disulfide isomerase|nr:DsbA family oxidoreductase [Saccharomonospora viridis]SFO86034.1 Predicted dithiol-disulfide isomerase, DsbA family [Saccharomonospora viridis]
MSASVRVDVWSDIACPWCYIGKRKFEAALAEFDGAADVTVTYRSFELAPDTPVDFDGSEVDFLAGYKGMPREQVEQMLRQVSAVAESVGLRYDFDALRHTKTLLAHQVLHHAKKHGKQLDLVERLFQAYFTEGRHVGRAEELAELAAEVGLDRDETFRKLQEGTYADAVQDDLRQAKAFGIRGVPFYVFNERYAVSGAQQPDVFLQALRKARSEGVSS